MQSKWTLRHSTCTCLTTLRAAPRVSSLWPVVDNNKSARCKTLRHQLHLQLSTLREPAQYLISGGWCPSAPLEQLVSLVCVHRLRKEARSMQAQLCGCTRDDTLGCFHAGSQAPVPAGPRS